MLRLVQGDVGCGKTLVAALAAASAIEMGRQVALMAPTELLADQHAQNFRRWLEPLGIAVALLTGRQTGKARRAVLEGIREGHAPLVIGTHALFQEGVAFASLALVIVDEQHRFGVHQRLSLREKGAQGGRQPHQLIMTATPIPRTLAMTAYADLDVSIIDELPPGRTPVKTVALADTRRDEVVMRIRNACLAGRQAYWVCPLIDESEEMPYQAAEETAAALAAALPELAVTDGARAHAGAGQGASHAPASRRARSSCWWQPPSSRWVWTCPTPRSWSSRTRNAWGSRNCINCAAAWAGANTRALVCCCIVRRCRRLARERLAVMRNTNDGFEVARRDLELRGPGELLGTRQTGLAQMRVADLLRDADLLPKVQAAAESLLRDWPPNIAPLIRRWVGHGEQYGRVG